MKCVNCLIYLCISGVLVFFLGRLTPKKWLLESRFPFRAFSFEKDGRIYEKIKVHKWKTKVPDMSRLAAKIAPKFMKKKAVEHGTSGEMKLLVKETCIAELAHAVSALSGIACIFIWRGAGGACFSVLWILFNLVFIVIQRYNRPRLQKMLKMLELREARNA